MNDKAIIEKLDYALTLLLGIETVDNIYNANNDNEILNIILNHKENE